MSGYIVSGTDTGIGKTVVSALLTLGLGATYWKPIQSGTEDGTDTQSVRALTGLPPERFIPERYVLTQPLSPHRAAEMDKVEIDTDSFEMPNARPLIVEGAGGLMVPVTRRMLQIDLFAAWGLPVILVARTGLGTINHTLLSIEVLRARKMVLHGLIFSGDDNADNIKTIADFTGARVLGHMRRLQRTDTAALQRVFTENFKKEDFA
jgi:dethiobiotin synthetase